MIKRIPIIKPQKNIESYLNKVELEIIKVFRFYGLPLERFVKYDQFTFLRIEQVIELDRQGVIQPAWDMHQAFGMYSFVLDAREQLKNNDSEGLAYSIGFIVRLNDIPYLPKTSGRQGKRAKESNLSRFTRFISAQVDEYFKRDSVISKSDFNIEKLIDGFDQLETTDIVITDATGDPFRYTLDNAEKSISRLKLKAKINKYIKSHDLFLPIQG